MNRIERILKTQMKMGFWTGYTMAMYPSQYAYSPVKVDFSEIWKDRTEVNLYYHIPFCKSLCPYCGFFTIAKSDTEYMKKYIEVLNKQVMVYSQYLNSEKQGTVKSICFGGGTPNHAPIDSYYEIFNTLQKSGLKFDEKLEPSMEVSPELLTEEYIRELKTIGVKRLSLGVQSLNLDLRTTINRKNNYNLLDLVELIRKYNLNMNIDVMSGIKGQSKADFMDTLIKLMEFKPETISIYPLAGKDSSMIKKDSNTMTNKDKYDLFREYYDYLLSQNYYCESNVKFVLKNQPSTHQQKIYEYQGIDTLGLGCAARSYNYYTHYSTENSFNQKNRIKLLDEFINSDFRDLNYYGFHMNETEHKSRFAIYGIFIGKIELSKYEKKFKTKFIADFPEQVEAIINLGLAKYDENGDIVTTKEGRVYTDIICDQFKSDFVNQKFKEHINK